MVEYSAKLYLHNDPRLPQGTGPYYNHEYINYFTVNANEWLMGLPPVPVQPNPGLGGLAIGPNHVDLYKESPNLVRKLDRHAAFDNLVRDGDFLTVPSPNSHIEPWKIFMLYSTEPDENLDCDLQLGRGQNLTGGSHGYRHMTFHLFGKSFGVTPQMVQYYMEAAQKAFTLGNQYWGWRFIARASHYLADMGHPFHVKVAPTGFLLKHIWHFSKAKKSLTAAHNGHEVFTEARFRRESNLFKQSLLEGCKKGYLQPTPKKELFKGIKWLSNQACILHNPLFNAILAYFGRDFVAIYDVGLLDPQIQKLDYSKQTNYMEAKAAEFLFRDEKNPGLAILDELTANALKNVGIMLGRLLNWVKSELGQIGLR